MPSSKLSNRRGTAQRPHVCHPPPPPPPIGPPPPPWPPGSIDMAFEYTYDWFMGPETEDWNQPAPRSAPSWIWEAFGLPIDNANINWVVDTVAETGILSIDGTSDNFGPYAAIKYDVPVSMGSTHIYVITDWDELTEGLISAKASFYF